MLKRSFKFQITLFSILSFIIFSGHKLIASEGIELYTPNTNISIPPGESIDYTIEVINHTQNTKVCNLTVSGVPRSWEYSLKSGSYNVKQIAVQAGEKQKLSFKIEVPYKVNKGNYFINLITEGSKLPLVINVSKQGSFKTEFITDHVNMQGHSKSNFSFRTTLKNRTADVQLYSLISEAPRGWQVTFKPDRKPATSVELDPSQESRISIDIKPPQNVRAGTYKIPVRAVTRFTSAKLELEIVITGTYGLNLSTPRGLVSTEITAGEEKKVDILVSNTGSAKILNLKLISSKPSGWEGTFNPSMINSIEPGSQVKATLTLKASKDAIAGDYITDIKANVPEASARLALRVAVKTPLLWGWVGILVILLSVGSIIYLFRKYGRR